jgi:WD40 repeat protein
VRDPAHPQRLATKRDSGTYLFGVAFSPNGKVVAAASADNLTRLWDVANPERPAQLGRPLRGPSSYAISVAFSPDGTTLAAGVTDGTVWLWNVSAPAHPGLLATLTGPNGHVYSVDFAPAGSELAAASADGTLRLWDTNPASAESAVCAGAGSPSPGKSGQLTCPASPTSRRANSTHSDADLSSRDSWLTSGDR